MLGCETRTRRRRATGEVLSYSTWICQMKEAEDPSTRSYFTAPFLGHRRSTKYMDSIPVLGLGRAHDRYLDAPPSCLLYTQGSYFRAGLPPGQVSPPKANTPVSALFPSLRGGPTVIR